MASACLLLLLAAGAPREMKTPESSRPGVPGISHLLTFSIQVKGRTLYFVLGYDM